MKLSLKTPLLAVVLLGTGAIAQPEEEPVPEGVLRLAEVRTFITSPLWYAWKLPSSKLFLAYVQAPAGQGAEPPRHVVVLNGQGKIDEKRTRDLKAAIEQVDPEGKCLAADPRSLAFGEVCNNLGMSYLARREHKLAEEVLAACEERFPDREQRKSAEKSLKKLQGGK